MLRDLAKGALEMTENSLPKPPVTSRPESYEIWAISPVAEISFREFRRETKISLKPSFGKRGALAARLITMSDQPNLPSSFQNQIEQEDT